MSQPTVSFLRPRRRSPVHWLGQATPWLVLCLGLGGTVWAWRVLSHQEQRYQASRLEGALAQTREAIDHRIEEQANLLHAVQGLVVGRPSLTAQDWHSFMANLEPRRLSPGVRMMGFYPRAALEGREVSPLVEPAEGGTEARALVKDPEFWEAASRARDTGGLSLTGRLNLAGSPGPSVALALPVFRDFSVPSDPTSRRAAFQGLVVGVVEGRALFGPMYGASPLPDLDVEIYDDPACRPNHLLYDRDLCVAQGGTPMAQREGALRGTEVVGGRTWSVVVGFIPTAVGSRLQRPRMIAAGGVLLSLLAFGLTLSLARGRLRLEALTHRLGESEARFRTVAETASCGIFIFSDHIEYMNEAGAKITGYPLDEIIGAPLWKVVHPLDRELVKSRAASRLRGDSVPLRYEFRLLTKSGETRWVDFAAGTVVIGERVLGLGTAFDVTERVRANQARLQVERRLAEAQKLESLGLLAGSVAHDFNNLLTVIQGNASMIRDAGDDPDLTRASLDNIEDTCRRASVLIGQMLTFSGRGRPQLATMNLNGLVQEVAHLLEVSLREGIRFAFELAADLPEVVADPGQIQQVVMNLVTNAAEAIREGSGQVTLRTGCCDLAEGDVPRLRLAEALKPGTFVFLEVEDTGAGMSGDTAARIFDPFFTTKPTGRGLGLAAMQGVIRGHGGGVEIRSRLGAGTAFRIYLPRDRSEASAEPEPYRSPGGEAGLVVVADDEPGIRDLARRALQGAGYEVQLAVDGAEAVELVREHLAQVVFVALDLTMPVMGGEEALTAIRALGYQGPVLRWSGFQPPEGLDVARGDFLAKPFSGRELLKAVRGRMG